jgi:electron transfer flavoprotein beta subunit
MKIAVIMRQVPDLIEPLEVNETGTALNLEEASFLANETDEHALEQAILLKEAIEGEVTVIALDFGDVDNTLFTAAARGADRIIKVAADEDVAPDPQATAEAMATVIKKLAPDLVLLGCYAHDELEGPLGPRLAVALGLPFVGVIRGVEAADDGSAVVFKEFPGAARARMQVALPAVLGIQGAEQPPRYVPVNRIRAAMKSAEIEESDVELQPVGTSSQIRRLFPPEKGEHAEILQGSPEEIASQIVELLHEKGLVK